MGRSITLGLTFASALSAAIGCNETPRGSGATAGSAPPSAPAPASSPPPEATASAAASASASAATPPPFAETETKPPTVAEWKEAKPLAVGHAASLWCDTRELREWIRVSCRAPEDAANQPTSLRVVRAPARGQHYELVRSGVASLVLQPRRGVTSSFAFEWSKWGARTLDVRFDAGTERPVVAFDAGGPAGARPGPRCEDVCPERQVFFNPMGNCSFPCGAGYRCAPGGEEVAAMCICDRCEL